MYSIRALGLAALVLVAFAIAGSRAEAVTIYEDAVLSADGWSHGSIVPSGDGNLRGLFTTEQVTRSFTPSPGTTSLTISFRFWALDTWDFPETGFFDVNGINLWNSQLGTSTVCPSPWEKFPGATPATVAGGIFHCYQDVTVEFVTTDAPFQVRFRSTLNQSVADESFAFNRLVISDNVVPAPSTVLLIATGLAALAWRVRRA